MSIKNPLRQSIAITALFSLLLACSEEQKPDDKPQQNTTPEVSQTDGISDGMEQEQIEEANEDTSPTTQNTQKGIYVISDGSATFTDCSTGTSYLVAPEERAAELERTYNAIKNQPQQKMLIEVKGEYDMRSPEEGDDVEMLIAQELLAFINKDSCQ